jgi:chromosomal replication initiation ATPase DnaA
MPPSRQIPIKFPEARLSFDDMAVTAANRSVCAAIRKPDRWPYYAFCLIGAAGSGISTIAQAWADEREARYFSGREFSKLGISEIEAITATDLAIDDVETLNNAEALLLSLSGIQRHDRRILLAAHTPPGQWRIQSPDLRSRLQGAPLAELPAPDEELMRARLRRAFARCYLDLPKTVEDYLVTRIGLDYSLIEQSAETLAGASGDRPLTIPLAREILGED